MRRGHGRAGRPLTRVCARKCGRGPLFFFPPPRLGRALLSRCPPPLPTPPTPPPPQRTPPPASCCGVVGAGECGGAGRIGARGSGTLRWGVAPKKEKEAFSRPAPAPARAVVASKKKTRPPNPLISLLSSFFFPSGTRAGAAAGAAGAVAAGAAGAFRWAGGRAAPPGRERERQRERVGRSVAHEHPPLSHSGSSCPHTHSHTLLGVAAGTTAGTTAAGAVAARRPRRRPRRRRGGGRPLRPLRPRLGEGERTRGGRSCRPAPALPRSVPPDPCVPNRALNLLWPNARVCVWWGERECGREEGVVVAAFACGLPPLPPRARSLNLNEKLDGGGSVVGGRCAGMARTGETCVLRVPGRAASLL